MPAVRSTVSTRSLTLVSTLLLSVAFSAPAFAQIETVVVTAEKRAENLQTVPVAVTAFTAEKRDEIGIQTIQDMANFTPGMTYSTSTDRVTMRGISRQTNVLSADSGVANYSDGIYQSFAVEAGRSSLDLDRVEILRGPQNTIYGRNSIGGVIDQITPRPTDTFQAEFRASYASYDASFLEGSVSGPINDDWQYRFYGDWQRQGLGWAKNIVPGMPEEGGVTDTWYGEAQLQGKIGQNFDTWFRFYSTAWDNGGGGPGAASGGWTPADYPTYETGQGALVLNPGYGCTDPVNGGAPLGAGGGTYSTADTTVVPGSSMSPLGVNACNNPSVKTPWKIARLTPYFDQVPGAYFMVNQSTWHADGFDIKYIGGGEWYRYILGGPNQYSGNYPAPISEYAIGPGPGVCGGACPLVVHPQPSFLYQQQEHFFQNELNFVSTTSGPFQWQTGVYWFQQHESQPVSAEDLGQPQLGTPISFGTAVPPELTTTTHSPFDRPNRWFADNISFNDTSMAVYGQADYQITPEFKLTGGLRYSYDRKYGSEQNRLVLFDSVGAAGIFPETAGAFMPAVDITPPPSVTGIPFTFCVIDYTPSQGCAGPFPDTGTQPATYNSATGFANRNYNHSSDALTGVARLDWTPDDSTLVYASYSRGYKGGGFNTGIFSFINPKPWVPAEHINAYEIGAKKTFEDWLVFDGAAFYYDYQDMQVPLGVAAPPGGVGSLAFESIPKVVSYGAEFEAVVTPIENLVGTISYSFNDAHITSNFVPGFIEDFPVAVTGLEGIADPADPNAVAPGARPVFSGFVGQKSLTGIACTPALCGTDIYTSGTNTSTNAGTTPQCAVAPHCGWVIPQSLKGQRLPNAPRNKVALNLLYNWNIPDIGTFTPSFTFIWRDSQYGTIFSRFYNKAPSWDQEDARISFKSPDEHWELIVWAKNLANTIGYDTGAIGTRYAGTIDRSCAGAALSPPTTGTVCNFVQGQTAGVGTPLPPGYGPVRGESAFGTVSTFSVNPPRTFGAELHFKF